MQLVTRIEYSLSLRQPPLRCSSKVDGSGVATIVEVIVIVVMN
jgi:hypothetical protein